MSTEALTVVIQLQIIALMMLIIWALLKVIKTYNEDTKEEKKRLNKEHTEGLD